MEPPSSTETTEMREKLQELFKQDPEARLLIEFRRFLADPVKPQNQDGRFRPHPLLILLGFLGGLAAAGFLYFSYPHL